MDACSSPPRRARTKRGQQDLARQVEGLPPWAEEIVDAAERSPVAEMAQTLKTVHKLANVLRRLIREKTKVREQEANDLDKFISATGSTRP